MTLPNHNSNITLAIVATTLIILILLVLVVLTMFMASRQRIKISENKLAFEKELRSVESEVKEATLSHLSSELHDNIGQILTLMAIQIEIGKVAHPASGPTFLKLTATLQDAITQIRYLSHSLNSDFIKHSGIQQIIAKEIDRLNNLGKQQFVLLTDETEPQLDKNTQLVIFRIFQELVNNALRHAKANTITVEVYGKADLQLTVKDDGKGFDLEAVNDKNSGMGLKNIVKRAELVGFMINITSIAGGGTKVGISRVRNPI